MADVARLHLYISGRVQGVFFRASARTTAKELALTGWVKNLFDGRVETIAEGPREKLLQFYNWCQKGPPGAQVVDAEMAWETPTGEFRNFSILKI